MSKVHEAAATVEMHRGPAKHGALRCCTLSIRDAQLRGMTAVVLSNSGVDPGTGVAGRLRPARGSRNMRTTKYHRQKLTVSMTRSIQKLFLMNCWPSCCAGRTTV